MKSTLLTENSWYGKSRALNLASMMRTLVPDTVAGLLLQSRHYSFFYKHDKSRNKTTWVEE
jgi:hypothetical protein